MLRTEYSTGADEVVILLNCCDIITISVACSTGLHGGSCVLSYYDGDATRPNRVRVLIEEKK